ncbi:MAG TPA: hypothetical protein VHB50_12070, partial [Bryobacteraceae bacterium]|nr:hypothetical protein [Bryobacteraceae bacterium]
MRHRVAGFAAGVLLALSAFGQNSIAVQSGAGFSGSMHFGAPMPFAMRAITGAPYSAEEVVEQVQTLADGTHISQKPLSTKVYRDSLGRTRTEKPLFRGMAVEG